ncbi:hypothetical protein GXN76_01460 [Kroppenstedtia pulmonis]|uniref:Ketosynthase family 3 (KS3) domain-containing protein n=1 Tax=Kroppenstedtia pulmonis TaxID=1380685 RepID=A0A7D3XHJ3_9BACL|nr:beta-ketoacyl synthase N-terminal-like domain-containing protein [Kroppenstedtia pulmonis]QKG83259.1 hypothetical protein GXN76_01460 [Kroppenstedtia pulmonis]
MIGSSRDSIAITGLGSISSFGVGVENVWSALEKGERKEPVAVGRNHTACCLQVGNWDATELLGQRGLKFLRPGTQYLLGAAKLALRDGKLSEEMIDPDELGVVVASNLSGMQSIADYDLTTVKKGPLYVSPMEAPNTLSNAPASHLAIRVQARALNTTVASGQCSGLDALGYAVKMLCAGRARYVLVGGVEELNERVVWLYQNSGVLPQDRPEEAGRPFDRNSSGWQPSEGAAVLLLECKSQALSRHAFIYGEVASWASAFALERENQADTLVHTAKRAVSMADIGVEDIELVVSGANGSFKQDRIEHQALMKLFAAEKEVPVTATKGSLGEMYSASGLFQAITAIGTLTRGVIPPTLCNSTGDPSIQPPGLRLKAEHWDGGEKGAVLLTSQDLFGSTSAVVLRKGMTQGEDQ